MANQDKYTLKEYEEAGFIDYGKGVNLDLSMPKSNLATDSGINVNVLDDNVGRDLETNPAINNLYNPDHDSSKDLKVFSLQDTFNMDSPKDIGTYDGMLKQAGYTDVAGLFNSKNVMLGIGGAFGGKLGYGKTLKGPTGKPVLSMGVLSEKALNNHYNNFAKVQQAYGRTAAGISNTGDAPFAGKINHKNTSTGFAMTLGNFHFSRDPSKGYFEGHKGHLSSSDHNAHTMLKSIEAMSKGLDPSGYRLDDKNENNRGMAAAVPNGIGGVTEDGYFTSVANNGLGWSKSRLYGGSSLSTEIAKAKGVNVMDLVKAMEMARSNKDLTVTDALKQLGATSDSVVVPGVSGADIYNEDDQYEDWTTSDRHLTDPAGKTVKQLVSQITAASNLSNTAGKSRTSTASSKKRLEDLVSQITAADTSGKDANVGTKWENQMKEVELYQTDIDSISKANKAAGFSGFGRHGFNQGGAVQSGYYGYQEGGQVSSPVGQLTDMLRKNRLGYQEGGEINMQEVGFVNGKTPDQVTDAQSVSDTEPEDARDGDFIINVPAVEAVGVENLIILVEDALQKATSDGVRIVDFPSDIPQEQLVEVLLSEGEFRIPRDLVPYVEGGIETLTAINNAGKKEVTQRVENSEDFIEEEQVLQESPAVQQDLASQQLGDVQQVSLRKGGEVFLDLDQGFI